MHALAACMRARSKHHHVSAYRIGTVSSGFGSLNKKYEPSSAVYLYM
jgi:hypothetical protein